MGKAFRGKGRMNNAEFLKITILLVFVPRDIQPQCRFIVRSVKIKLK